MFIKTSLMEFWCCYQKRDKSKNAQEDTVERWWWCSKFVFVFTLGRIFSFCERCKFHESQISIQSRPSRIFSSHTNEILTNILLHSRSLATSTILLYLILKLPTLISNPPKHHSTLCSFASPAIIPRGRNLNFTYKKLSGENFKFN